MKSNAIIRIIIWGIVLVLLVGILTAFVVKGQYPSIATEPVYTVPMDIAEATPVTALPHNEKLVLAGESIDSIEIEWIAGDILILPENVENITVSESGAADEAYAMVWSMDGRTLKLSFCEEKHLYRFGISFGSDIHSKDLYISVPLDWNCRSLEIDAASSTVEIHGMTIGQIDLDSASGTIRVENCDILDMDIDTASGDVIFSGTLNTLDFDAASANFIGEFRSTPSRLDIDSLSGKLDISLPEDCGYSLSMDGMSKTFHSDFQGTENHNGIHTYGDGRCRIKVDGMSCDVNIRKYESKIQETQAP